MLLGDVNVGNRVREECEAVIISYARKTHLDPEPVQFIQMKSENLIRSARSDGDGSVSSAAPSPNHHI